nr:hypothetical protein [uncultured Agathobaculum sp.]
MDDLSGISIAPNNTEYNADAYFTNAIYSRRSRNTCKRCHLLDFHHTFSIALALFSIFYLQTRFFTKGFVAIPPHKNSVIIFRRVWCMPPLHFNSHAPASTENKAFSYDW